MKLNMQHRKALIADLSQIINLLLEDELGKDRETQSTSLDQRYILEGE